MKRVMTSMAALAIGAGAAHAGGVERSTQSVGILFEQGNYADNLRTLEEITDYIGDKMAASRTRCLWGTANMFSSAQYGSPMSTTGQGLSSQGLGLQPPQSMSQPNWQYSMGHCS